MWDGAVARTLWPARGHTRRSALHRDQKAEAIAALTARLRENDTVFAADYRGLTVKQLAELRARLRPLDTELSVVKNTLTRRAAQASGREALGTYLIGPTALAWVGGDPAVAAKALQDFATQHPGAMSVKGGLLEGADLPADDLVRLSRLPAREHLLAQLAGGIAAPLTGLAGTLNGLLSGLARTLAAVQSQRAAQAS